MKRFQDVSKYRNAVGSTKKEAWYSELSLTASGSATSNLLASNEEWIAYRSSVGASSIGLLHHDAYGRRGHQTVTFQAGGVPSDFEFSPFDDNLLAVGCEDGSTNVWHVPSDETVPQSQAKLANASARIERAQWHPSAAGILATAYGKTVTIWDVSKESSTFTLTHHSDTVHDLAWRANGTTLATTAKDHILRIYDPRSGQEATVSGNGHAGLKPSRLVWLGNTDQIFTTGFSKFRDREYALWDARNLEKAVKTVKMDGATGTLIPLRDPARNIVYLVGKGDATIRFVEIGGSNTFTEGSCPTGINASGATLAPHSTLDVMKAEIDRVLLLTSNDDAIVPVNFNVPRRQYLDFHTDIFPSTPAGTAAMSATDWIQGEDAVVESVSQDPSIRQKLSKNGVLTYEPATLEKGTGVAESNKISIPAAIVSGTDGSSISPSAKVSLPATEQLNPSSESRPSPNEAPAIAKPLPTDWSRRYLAGKVHHPSRHYNNLSNLNTGLSPDTSLLYVNTEFIFVPLTGSGGQVGFHPIETTGRLPISMPAIVCGAAVVDFATNFFNPSQVASATDDGKVRVWKVSKDTTENITEPAQILEDSSMERISFILYHPTVQDVLLSMSADGGSPHLRLWDLTSSSLASSFPVPSGAFDGSFNQTGSLIALACKDKKLRVYDVLKGELVSESESHDSVRSSKVVWLQDDIVCTVGFGRGSQREAFIHKGSERVARLSLDISPGVLFPSYDPDTGILLMYAKGDRSIMAIEVTYANGKVSLSRLPTFEAGGLQNGFVTLPKRFVDVKVVEIIRGFRLTPTMIESVAFSIPRNRTEFFQDDIYIPTADVEKPALVAKEWLSRQEAAESPRRSLAPSDMKPLSQAPPLTQSRGNARTLERVISDEERKEDAIEQMFAKAKLADEEDDDPYVVKATAQGAVADDEWD